MKAKTTDDGPKMTVEWYLRLEGLLRTVGMDDPRLLRELCNLGVVDQNAVYCNFATSFPEFKDRFPTWTDFWRYVDSRDDRDEIDLDGVYEDPWVMEINLKGWYKRCGDKPHPAYFLLPVERHEDLTREEKMELTRLAPNYIGRDVGSGRSFAFAKKAKFQGVTQKLFVSVRRGAA